MREENKQLESEMAESNNKSAKALLWFSGIIIFLGFNAENHAGLGVAGLFLFSLAAIFSTLALFLGSNQTKIMSLFSIVITILFAIKSYSVYEHRMDRHSESIASSETKNIKIVLEAYFADHQEYPAKFESIEYTPHKDSVVTYIGGGQVYRITVKHKKTETVFETTQELPGILKNGERM